jgi:hypothetical protein
VITARAASALAGGREAACAVTRSSAESVQVSGHQVVTGAGRQLQRPDLLTAVPADQLGRDAVQPGPDTGPRAVVTGPDPEGRQKGLGGDVVGRVPAGAPGDVLVDGGRVPVEQHGEALGFVERRGDAATSTSSAGVASGCAVPLPGEERHSESDAVMDGPSDRRKGTDSVHPLLAN